MAQTNNEALLLLEDGTVFYGKPAGSCGITTGEIAFNTGMTGYQEIFTDPSYYGQIVVMTAAHIGNYGVRNEEAESDGIKVAGMVCKKFSNDFSRPAASGSLQKSLEESNIVSICDVDTRAVVRHIRSKGAMNALICSDGTPLDELRKILSEVPSMTGLELSSRVSTTQARTHGSEQAPFHVVLIDYGVKQNIIRCLLERNCKVTSVPMKTGAREILALKPDGILLSNGPGDPEAMQSEIAVIAELVQAEVPIFGICLGHQLLALSQNLNTEKMFNGHRGINHPIKNLVTGKGEITSQNHGFVVKSDLDTELVEITHRHLNDNTVAGIRLTNKPAFSVQYHPEAAAGPHDSRYLFDDFILSIEHYLHSRKNSNQNIPA